MNTDLTSRMLFTCFSAIITALSPTLPYIALCTAAVQFDCFTAWQLGKRVAKTYPEKATKNAGKFKSSRFGDVIVTMIQVYMLLIFSFFLEVYVTDWLPFNALKVAAGMVIGWQAWSSLENISSCNGAKWAIILQQIMVDKTSRHFDIDLSQLKKKGDKNEQHN